MTGIEPAGANPASGSAPANRDQLDFWAREGEHWAREADRYDAMNHRFGEVMLDAARLRPGAHVLDVGCGNGATTLAAARRVAPGGSAIGVDISAPMLALARRRAADSGCDNVEFLEADAQVHPFEEGRFDAIISRFGTTFFDDTVAAFANVRHALTCDGRLSIVCWQDVFQSEWIIVPGAAAAEHVGLPDFGPPGAPGPFALADGEKLRRMLETAGFLEVTIEPVTEPMRIGDDADDAIGFVTSLGMVRDDLFAGKPEDKIAAAVDAARRSLEPYEGPDGVTMMGGAWLASARR
jgi:SAM-dependent methyltransferase